MRASKSINLSLAVTVLLVACGSSSSSQSTIALKPKIIISSTNDPTSVMLAEIYGQALEKAQFRVARKQTFDTSAALYAAMVAGDVQVTGATTQDVFAWLETQSGKTDPLPPSTVQQVDAISKALPKTLKLAAASTAEDKDVIFCATSFTQANKIATLTDLGTKKQTATLAAPDGFETATPLGGASLNSTYQITFKAIVPTAKDKIIAAVTGAVAATSGSTPTGGSTPTAATTATTGGTAPTSSPTTSSSSPTADCGVGRSADPALSAATFTVLEDDKAVVPNNVMLPLVTTAAGTIDVTSVLDATSAKLTTAKLRALMQRLKDGASPELAANEFTGSA